MSDIIREARQGRSDPFKVNGETGEVTDLPSETRTASAAEQASGTIGKSRGKTPEEPEQPERPPPDSLQAALAGLVHRPFLDTQKYQEQQWRANREGAHPAILDWEDWTQAKLRKMGIPMFAHCVVRTWAEQAAQFAQGDSRDSPADGLWPHRGTAIDLVHSTRAWNLEPREWLLIGHVGKEIAAQHGLKLVWGGDWRKKPTDIVGWDPAHWEVANWRVVAGEYPWPDHVGMRTMQAVRKHRAAQRADMKKRFGG